MDDIVKKFINLEGLSDIHIRSNKPVSLRINGEINKQEIVVSENQINIMIKKLLYDRKKEIFEKKKDVDLAFVSNNIRFRANIFQSSNGPAIVLRKINDIVPEISSLNLPPVINDVIREKAGLILVTGATGSGKSTSIASMINEINKTRKENIITIEDPIEFVHKDQESIVSQREIGKDANTFHDALRAALREDPDVILVGELRDVETISMALTAAETGHLVLSTLHTSSAVKTIDRIKANLNPELGIRGVLLTMFDKRNKLSLQVDVEARKHFKDKVYKTVVPRNVRLSEAPSHGMPCLIYDKNCSGSKSYINLAEEFINQSNQSMGSAA